MNTKLYVDNLSANTTEGDLLNLFSAYGNVADVNIAVDRIGKDSRCCGFVTMVTPEAARAAIRSLHGKVMGEERLTVRNAEPHEDRTQSSGPGRKPSFRSRN